MENYLTVIEKSEFYELENRIERGLQTFVEVGSALLKIRDGRLYRESHVTFEGYCQERWGLKRQRAYELMGAAAVVGNLSEISDKPLRESHTAALHSLNPERQIEAWQTAVATAPNGRITARHVEDTVKRMTREDYDDGWEDYEEPAIEYDPKPEVILNGRDMAVHYSSENNEWETPQDLFDLLNLEFNFNLDVCALPENAKCPVYYSPLENGLSQDWRGVCWMNPPYGNEIREWMGKAYNSAKAGSTVVCLVPARVDTGWWWNYCIHGEVRFLRGRLKFSSGENSAPFPSAVVIFRSGVSKEDSKVIWWEAWG